MQNGNGFLLWRSSWWHMSSICVQALRYADTAVSVSEGDDIHLLTTLANIHRELKSYAKAEKVSLKHSTSVPPHTHYLLHMQLWSGTCVNVLCSPLPLSPFFLYIYLPSLPPSLPPPLSSFPPCRCSCTLQSYNQIAPLLGLILGPLTMWWWGCVCCYECVCVHTCMCVCLHDLCTVCDQVWPQCCVHVCANISRSIRWKWNTAACLQYIVFPSASFLLLLLCSVSLVLWYISIV